MKIIDTTNELLGRLKRQNSLRISRAVLYLAIFPQIGRDHDNPQLLHYGPYFFSQNLLHETSWNHPFVDRTTTQVWMVIANAKSLALNPEQQTVTFAQSVTQVLFHLLAPLAEAHDSSRSSTIRP